MKTIFITGASSGVGLASLEEALKRGHKVIATSRAISKIPPRQGLIIKKMDISKDEEVKAVIESVFKEQKIDVLFNNAGLGFFKSLEDTSFEELKAIYEVNFFGSIRVLKACLPYFRAQRGGLILNNASMAADVPLPFGSIYNSSKAALAMLSSCLRMEVASFGVDIACLKLGLIESDFENKVKQNKKSFDAQSPYSTLTNKLYAFLAKNYKNATSSKEIAAFILDIFESSQIAPIYTVGKMAKSTSLLYRIFGEGLCTKVFMKDLEKF